MPADLVKSLQQLDLSKIEAEVYLALLKLGASNAGPIISQTGLHRQFVYSGLNTLKERGLCTYVVRNGRRVFEASSPQALVRVQRERERKATELIPQLEALSSKSSDRFAVTTLRGIKEFHENLITTLEEAAKGDRILRVVGGGGGSLFYEMLGSFYDTYIKAGQRLKVKKHLLTSFQQVSHFQEIFAKESGTELRLSEFLSAPTYTRITPALVTIEVYSADPMIIQIWNRSIAQSHREHFELLWERSKRVGC